MAQSSGKSGIATLMGWRGDVIRDAPPAPYVDPSAEAAKAIAGNRKNLPDAVRLAGETDKANADLFLAMMERLVPGWSGIAKTITNNIGAWSRGELSKGTSDMISRHAAERAGAQGTAGSGFHFAGEARDLGRTSEDYMARAQTSFERWTQMISGGAPRMDFMRGFISPELQIQNQWRNEENRWNVAWLETQLKAQPSNAEQAYAQIADFVADYASMAASIYGNKAMGGGGAGGAGNTGGGGASGGW